MTTTPNRPALSGTQPRIEEHHSGVGSTLSAVGVGAVLNEHHAALKWLYAEAGRLAQQNARMEEFCCDFAMMYHDEHGRRGDAARAFLATALLSPAPWAEEANLSPRLVGQAGPLPKCGRCQIEMVATHLCMNCGGWARA